MERLKEPSTWSKIRFEPSNLNWDHALAREFLATMLSCIDLMFTVRISSTYTVNESGMRPICKSTMHVVLHWKVTLEREKGKELGKEGGGDVREANIMKKGGFILTQTK